MWHRPLLVLYPGTWRQVIVLFIGSGICLGWPCTSSIMFFPFTLALPLLSPILCLLTGSQHCICWDTFPEGCDRHNCLRVPAQDAMRESKTCRWLPETALLSFVSPRHNLSSYWGVGLVLWVLFCLFGLVGCLVSELVLPFFCFLIFFPFNFIYSVFEIQETENMILLDGMF